MLEKYLLENKTKHTERKVNGNVIKVNRNSFSAVHKKIEISWQEGNLDVFEHVNIDIIW